MQFLINHNHWAPDHNPLSLHVKTQPTNSLNSYTSRLNNTSEFIQCKINIHHYYEYEIVKFLRFYCTLCRLPVLLSESRWPQMRCSYTRCFYCHSIKVAHSTCTNIGGVSCGLMSLFVLERLCCIQRWPLTPDTLQVTSSSFIIVC